MNQNIFYFQIQVQLVNQYYYKSRNRQRMKDKSINQDEFLTQKQIQIQRSSFLANHYAKKSFMLKDSYNPRDPYGSRLSHYWQPGDSVWTVIWKKIVDNVRFVLNPDTYSQQSVQKVKENLLKYKIEVVSLFLIIGIPVIIIFPVLRPRFKKIKREFLFQYYLQSQLLAKRLQTKSIKLPVHQVQQIIKKAQTKVRL